MHARGHSLASEGHTTPTRTRPRSSTARSSSSSTPLYPPYPTSDSDDLDRGSGDEKRSGGRRKRESGNSLSSLLSRSSGSASPTSPTADTPLASGPRRTRPSHPTSSGRRLPFSQHCGRALRRAAAAPRRTLLVATVLLAALYFLLSADSVGLIEPFELADVTGLWDPEPTCDFMSTVDAYHRDLARLRGELGYDSAQRSPSPKEANSTTHTDRGRQHYFSPNGHLILDTPSGAPHPIPALLTLGEERWAELLDRQSRTLEEAVAEYQRRHGRKPPRGFDRWWEFAMEHNVVLPDEYDRINLDLAPFLALPKAELKKRLQLVQDMPEVFTLRVEDGSVGVEIKDRGGLNWKGTMPRARQTAQLLKSFARYLPNLRATFSIFDQPQIYLSWARRDSLVSLALEGKHTTAFDEDDDGRVRLSRSCAPGSALRTSPYPTSPDSVNSTASPSTKSLVYDGELAGDVCHNPYLIPRHGLTIEPHEPDSHPRPHTRLLPLFSLAKTSVNSDILITPLEQFDTVHKRDKPWEEKRDPRLAWRGRPTGISMMDHTVKWRDSHRWRLHLFANDGSQEPTQVLVPKLSNGSEGVGMASETLPTREAHKWFFDMHLTGGPLQCSDADGTCDQMRHEIRWAPYQSPRAARESKFLLDIDGNGWSGRFRRLMATNSVVIKTGIFTEWFQPHLIPWFMYVPSKLDFSDLADIMAFFSGSPAEPNLAFDETAKALGHNGKCFVQRMFRYEDLQAYMLRLFLEYARIVADDGVDMDYHGPIGADDAYQYSEVSTDDD